MGKDEQWEQGGGFINTLGILSLISSIFYVWLGVYGYTLYKRGRINRIFLAISFCLAIWAFGYGFFYSASSMEKAWFWFRVSAAGWIFMPALLLMFGMEAAGLLKKQPGWVIGLLWIWPFIEFYKVLSGVLTAEDFVFKPYGTVEITSFYNPWYWLHIFYYTLYIGAMFFLLYRWGRQSPLKREKMQAFLIIGFGFFILISGMITNLILPAVRGGFPGIAHFLGIVWAVGFLYAVSRYRFMRFDYSLLLENIIAHVNDMVFLLRHDFRIIKVNKRGEELLGRKEEEVLGRFFWQLVENKDEVKSDLLNLKQVSRWQRRVTFLDIRGKKILTRTFYTAIKDDFGDIIVITVVSQDIRLIRRLREEVRERRNREKELRYLSLHDTLTGLYNRTYFMDWMQKLDEDKTLKAGLIICDLDGLKEINDKWGHQKGDEFIAKAAQVLKKCVREEDKVMRIGGDEFAVLMLDVDEGVVKKVANRIKETFSCEGNLPDGDICTAGISVGYAWRGDGIMPSEELFRLADSSMYDDKYKNKCNKKGMTDND